MLCWNRSALGAVLGDGDVEVGVEVGGRPRGEAMPEAGGEVLLRHGQEEDDARQARPLNPPQSSTIAMAPIAGSITLNRSEL